MAQPFHHLPNFWMTIEEVFKCGGFFVSANDDIPYSGPVETELELFDRSATFKMPMPMLVATEDHLVVAPVRARKRNLESVSESSPQNDDVSARLFRAPEMSFSAATCSLWFPDKKKTPR